MIKYQKYPDYVRNIAESHLSIYDAIEPGDPDLWIPTPDLEKILSEGLRGFSKVWHYEQDQK